VEEAVPEYEEEIGEAEVEEKPSPPPASEEAVDIEQAIAEEETADEPESEEPLEKPAGDAWTIGEE